MNTMASDLAWAASEFDSCLMMVMRSPIPFKASTTPVLAMKAPAHPALGLPHPGMTPYTLLLPVDPHTLVMLTLGDFGGDFSNKAVPTDVALGLGQQYVGQFAFFDTIRHLITGREDVIASMTWAPYDLVSEDDRKIVFRRRPEAR